MGFDRAEEEARAPGNGGGQLRGMKEGLKEMDGRLNWVSEEEGMNGEDTGDLGRGKANGEEEGMGELERREGVGTERRV